MKLRGYVSTGVMFQKMRTGLILEMEVALQVRFRSYSFKVLSSYHTNINGQFNQHFKPHTKQNRKLKQSRNQREPPYRKMANLIISWANLIKFKADQQYIKLQENEVAFCVCKIIIQGDFPIYLPSTSIWKNYSRVP